MLMRIYKKWKLYTSTTLILSISVMMSLSYFKITINELKEIEKCPICFGLTACHLIDNNKLTINHKDIFALFSNYFGTKNVYYGKMDNVEIVLKKLAHSAELKYLDDAISQHVQNRDTDFQTLIEKAVSTNMSDTASKLRLCPTTKNINLLFHNILSNEDFIYGHLWTLIEINPEPLILQVLPATVGWPVPKYYGACGRLVIEEFVGPLLNTYYQRPWIHRAEIASSLLDAAYMFTFGNENFAYYLTDVSSDNIAVDSNNRAKFIDLENIIVVDKMTPVEDDVDKLDRISVTSAGVLTESSNKIFSASVMDKKKSCDQRNALQKNIKKANKRQVGKFINSQQPIFPPSEQFQKQVYSSREENSELFERSVDFRETQLISNHPIFRGSQRTHSTEETLNLPTNSSKHHLFERPGPTHTTQDTLKYSYQLPEEPARMPTTEKTPNSNSLSLQGAGRCQAGGVSRRQYQLPEEPRRTHPFDESSSSRHAYKAAEDEEHSGNQSDSSFSGEDIEKKSTLKDDDISSTDSSLLSDDENVEEVIKNIASALPMKIKRSHIQIGELFLNAMKHAYEFRKAGRYESKTIFKIPVQYFQHGVDREEISPDCGFYFPKEIVAYIKLQAKSGSRLFKGLHGWVNQITSGSISMKAMRTFVNKCISNKRKYKNEKRGSANSKRTKTDLKAKKTVPDVETAENNVQVSVSPNKSQDGNESCRSNIVNPNQGIINMERNCVRDNLNIIPEQQFKCYKTNFISEQQFSWGKSDHFNEEPSYFQL